MDRSTDRTGTDRRLAVRPSGRSAPLLVQRRRCRRDPPPPPPALLTVESRQDLVDPWSVLLFDSSVDPIVDIKGERTVKTPGRHNETTAWRYRAMAYGATAWR